MPAPSELTGKVYHQLTVLGKSPLRTSLGRPQWECQCTCGNIIHVWAGALNSGNTKSCGCRRVNAARELGRRTVHGMTKTPEYKAWQSMKDRCYNEDCQNFPLYGARGIIVWDAWMKSFPRFLEDVGLRPGKGYSLDRIDVNGNYRPDNCRWATAEEQSNNKRNNIKFTVGGVERSVAQLARDYNIPVGTLVSRLFRDQLTIEDALSKVANKHDFTHDGVTQSIRQWANELGITYSKTYSHCITKRLSIASLIHSVKGSS